jgi:hypothetical protein
LRRYGVFSPSAMSANPAFLARQRLRSRAEIEPKETKGACRGGCRSTEHRTVKENHHSRKSSVGGRLRQFGGGAVCSRAPSAVRKTASTVPNNLSKEWGFRRIVAGWSQGSRVNFRVGNVLVTMMTGMAIWVARIFLSNSMPDSFGIF